jgi:SAM-dependent methyltransferase
MHHDRICPLCGEANRCGVALGKGVCWCFSTPVPHAVIEQIPEEYRGRACVCEPCASIKAPHSFLTDGRHYDALHATARQDIAFWVARAREARGRVLELACGTGRITLPIAEAGVPIVGIDTNGAYLEQARQQAATRRLPASFVHGDMRAFDLDDTLEYAFIGFQSVACLTHPDELETCFGRVRQHLRPGGRFIFDAFNPDPRGYETRPDERLTYADPDSGQTLAITRSRAYDARTRVEMSVFRYEAAETSPRRSAALALRLHAPGEIQDALVASGFHVAEHWDALACQADRETERVQLIVATAV